MAICLNFVYLHQLMDKEVIQAKAYRQGRSILKTTLSQVQQYTVSFLRSSFRSRLNYSLLMKNLILYLYRWALIKRIGRQAFLYNNCKAKGQMVEGLINQEFSCTLSAGKPCRNQYLNLRDSKRWCSLSEQSMKGEEIQDAEREKGVDFIYGGKDRQNPFSKIFGFRELITKINRFRIGKSNIFDNAPSFSPKQIHPEKEGGHH